MAKHTRHRHRKGARKTRRASRKSSTRRMKRGGGFFTKNSAVAPRPAAAVRIGSVAAKTAANEYVKKKGDIETLLDVLNESVKSEMKEYIPDFTTSKTANNYKGKLTLSDIDKMRTKKINIGLEAFGSQNDFENAVSGVDNLMKFYKQENQSKFKQFLQTVKDSVRGDANKLARGLGVDKSSIKSLMSELRNNTLTLPKAATLAKLLVQLQKDLDPSARKTINNAEKRLGLDLPNMMGGKDPDGVTMFFILVISVLIGLVTGGIGGLIAFTFFLGVASKDD